MSYQYYLISSLPMLHFGMKPPFSWEKFLTLSEQFLPQKEQELLMKVSLSGDYQDRFIHPLQKSFQAFDIGLRNELVKIRSLHRHADPEKYMRQGGKTESYIGHIANSAHKSPDILEGEKILDEARWQELDELVIGHYFDLDFLIIYALKLLLLERWERINTADKVKLLEEVLQKVA